MGNNRPRSFLIARSCIHPHVGWISFATFHSTQAVGVAASCGQYWEPCLSKSQAPCWGQERSFQGNASLIIPSAECVFLESRANVSFVFNFIFTMSGTTFSDEILETNSGTVTTWLPLSTPWLSIQACSSQIYAQRAGLGANLIAFDPLYGLEISASAIPCLPSEVTAWYLQAQTNSLTTTLLGPTFVCPGAYSAVETILVNSKTQQILCCPS
jgi:hypothetical protein